MRRGDVIVFAPGVSEERKYFIKRVIGLPGETVKIENGKVYFKTLDAESFEEIQETEYLSVNNENNTTVHGDTKAHEYIVPKGSYFVMGDNRTHSSDSRSCFQTCRDPNGRDEYVKQENIMGRVLLDL